MRQVYNFFSSGAALLLFFSIATLHASEPYSGQDFTKTIKKEFPISPEGKVKISNRYGKVQVDTWDRDRVKIDVRITVRASSEERAQKGFERISINFTDSPDYVSAETDISDGEKSFWEIWTSSWGKIDFTIDYRVTMPPTCDLELNNKYGDSWISDLAGDVSLDIKYGNFEFDGTPGRVGVILGYGNGFIEKSANISADGKYCSLELNSAGQVDITSKYSKVKIEEANIIRSISKYDSYNIVKTGSFRNEGKYDHFRIGTIDDLHIISKYTDLHIEKLRTSADVEMRYGGARVDDLAKGFHEINLVGQYADFKINVEEDAHYQVKAVTDYAGFKYPANFKVSFVDEKGAKKEMNGYIGEKNARGIINAQLDYGGLKVW